MAITSLTNLKSKLETLGYPVYYKKAFFENKVNPETYIIYHTINETNIANASDKTVWKGINVQINLITNLKDESIEQQLETLLTEEDVIYNVISETYDDEERKQLRIYDMQINKFL